MSYVTDEPITDHMPVSNACTCDPFDAVYTYAQGRFYCLNCKQPRPVIVQPEDVCKICHGNGCDWCSWGCNK